MYLNPKEILNQIEISEDMAVADFGSGSGGWVLPLARKIKEAYPFTTLPGVGPWKIYAIDILEEPLSALRGKAEQEKLPNIETMRADIEKGTTLAPDSCDLVLMTNLLFQISSTPDVDGKTSGVKRVLEEGKRVMKKGGKILLVDWKKEAALGPREGRVSVEEVKKIAKGLGLKLEKEFDASPYHFGLILEKF